MKHIEHKNSMRIYVVELSPITEKKLSELYMLISEERRLAVRKLLNKKDKIRSVIGELLVRMVMHFAYRKKNIIFARTREGKPYVDGEPLIHFNVSHAGDYILCAFASHPVGVDVEEVKEIAYEDIVQHCFTKQERQYIFQPIPSPLHRFYEIWTLKESYVKCVGKGLSIPLDSFSCVKGDSIKVFGKDVHEKYTCQQISIHPNYKVAVCSTQKSEKNIIIRTTQEEIISYFQDILDISLVFTLTNTLMDESLS
ncbi:cereulide biosynthesis 4'-phosphopantetheinyl transferase CesP [Bacillus cereus]|uniref:Phosphopantetheine-protein transferase domain protein n=1 Tax=Bacillus cereus MC67 TaxID=1053219 RepID=J8EZU3_BACCE|nr:cereulide biosynthesis 4'-phosphopantetheinyl transferase CesP [Bacillus cereus]EJQ93985.1 phosphopantetheine-protein transferase domain protein [Bacillus cereus MC67]EOP05708.1 phosphopantetheine-protein transferase domain protein [Bacillus cereus MC118]